MAKQQPAENLKNENLAIWDAVSITDPHYTKVFGYGANGNQLTTVNHNYQVQRATALFGPCGIGWGYDIVDEKYIKGPALHAERPDAGNHTVHVLQVKLWYSQGDKKGFVNHFGQTKMTYLSEGGSIVFDEDAPKKSLTDALGKCMSMIGFSADVYQGQFETKPENTDLSSTNNSSQIQAVTLASLEDTPESLKIKEAKDVAELTKYWTSLTTEQRAIQVNLVAKNEMKLKLSTVTH